MSEEEFNTEDVEGRGIEFTEKKKDLTTEGAQKSK
jgi:hypothetical protein